MTTLLKIYLQQFFTHYNMSGYQEKITRLAKKKKKPTQFLETEHQNQHGWEVGTKR